MSAEGPPMVTPPAGPPGDEGSGPPGAPSGEEGSGTVLTLVLVFLLLTALATLSLIGRAAVARQRAAAAADLVALAVVADAPDLPPGSCPARSWAVAGRVARSMAASPVSCQVLTDGSVLVQVAAAGPGSGIGDVSEWARAGGGQPTPVPRAKPP